MTKSFHLRSSSHALIALQQSSHMAVDPRLASTMFLAVAFSHLRQAHDVTRPEFPEVFRQSLKLDGVALPLRQVEKQLFRCELSGSETTSRVSVYWEGWCLQ